MRTPLSKIRGLVLVLAFASELHAARPRNVAHPPYAPPAPPRDIFSAAELDVRTEHLSLDLTVDFSARVIRGSATHRIRNFSGSKRFVVDTRDLNVSAVSVDGRAANWSYGPSGPNGRALSVDIASDSREVRFDYATSPSSPTLRWFDAKQTLGRVAPFVWIQSEPDYARGWLPIQDTPAVRMTWSATVRVPSGLMAVMSTRNATAPNESGVYTFDMKQTVPPYLIVLAAGRLAFRALDERTGIYAEPEQLDDAQYEMSFIPSMLDAAERIITPYPWERYDILLAPSFPGGMENPNLNFIGANQVTGNHPDPVVPSGLIAHEMAHSWFGDMLTCATWSDTWLNEGFATYYEKRILEELAGTERAELGFFTDRLNYEDYLASSNPPPSRALIIHRPFANDDRPSAAFSLISYQKGGLFLKMLEDRLGRSLFDQFIHNYATAQPYDWVDDREFLSVLASTLASATLPTNAIDTSTWLYAPQKPVDITAPTSSRIVDRVNVQALAFRNGAKQVNTTGWTTVERGVFLQLIGDLVPSRLADLDAAFNFAAMKTPPTVYLLGIARTMDPARLPVLEQFLMRGLSSSLSLWQELGRTSTGRAWGRNVYAKAREFYDDPSRSYIDNVLKVSSGTALREAA